LRQASDNRDRTAANPRIYKPTYEHLVVPL